jgi:hypothetical protein
MSVQAEGAGSLVKIVTEYSIAGRVAQFGRGVMEDVSRRIVNDMAACIKANVEAQEPGSSTPATGGPAQATGGTAQASGGSAPMAPVTAKPINAVSLFFQVLWTGVRRVFGAKA